MSWYTIEGGCLGIQWKVDVLVYNGRWMFWYTTEGGCLGIQRKVIVLVYNGRSWYCSLTPFSFGTLLLLLLDFVVLSFPWFIIPAVLPSGI